jgi:uracil-DNA glycosylase
MTLAEQIPAPWQDALQGEVAKPYFARLQAFLDEEWRQNTIYPPRENVFSALEYVPPRKVRVLLLGQDPYHDENQAHGLCFSVRPGVKLPPSLRNIFKELQSDLGIGIPEHGCLTHWAEQGVLMLNTVLTVRAHAAHSHAKKGWETFTDAVIRTVNASAQPVVFVLWGNPAQKKRSLIDAGRHPVISSAHPSPLSAYRGFFGSRPFSAINRSLRKNSFDPIDWQLPACCSFR